MPINYVQDYLCVCGTKHTSYRERGNRFPDVLPCTVCGLYEGLRASGSVIEIGEEKPKSKWCECDACKAAQAAQAKVQKTLAQEAWEKAVGVKTEVFVAKPILCDECEHMVFEKSTGSKRFCAGFGKLMTPRTSCISYRLSEEVEAMRNAFKAEPVLPVFGGLDIKKKTLGVTLPPGWSITVKQES
jgi:hypothetical protein